MDINNILQNFIYTFNNSSLRNKIIRTTLKDYNKTKNIIWKGTFMIDKSSPVFHAHKKWKDKKKTYAFTVAYVYRDNLVHYVSFLLESSKKRLICFDPGHSLYLYGEMKIIPMVVNELTKSSWITNKIIMKTKCAKKYYDEQYGIQYDGRSPFKTNLPADSFCQSWTLFFIVRYIESNGDLSFFPKWCLIDPKMREYFILHTFIIPVINKDPVLRKKLTLEMRELQTFLLQDFWKKIGYHHEK